MRDPITFGIKSKIKIIMSRKIKKTFLYFSHH